MLSIDNLQLQAHTPDLLGALAVGLVIGLERAWRERDVADGGRVAGLRTFALTGLLGGVFALLGSWVLAAATLGLMLLGTVTYREGVRSTSNLSATSAIAQWLTFGLGALSAGGSPALAISAAVIVAMLLNLRSTLHRWLRLIEHRELSAALQMLVLSAVVLPMLPDAPYGPYGALNPYRLWWAVVLIAGLSLSGHVAVRMAGPQRGALWTGLLGGLASSTAATLALARQLRDRPGLVDAATAGALSACAVMFLRLALIVMSMAPSLGRLMLAPMVSAAVALIAIALVYWRRRDLQAEPVDPAQMQPFDLSAALGFGAFLGLMSVLSEASKQWIGVSGLYGLALLSGLVDVDAVTISAARLDAAGSVAGGVAAAVVALAILSNMVTKAAMSWIIGGRLLGRRVAMGYLMSMVAGAAMLAVSVSRA
ncbi:MgtC/SapB family protein [Aquabacterium sp. A7-Y]|uniref:MgtC/SapB family protein n=1 Tax=Aquabacterium sp. A7-Y TaxID=1349605 RepID=UPI00223CC993|nr:MgtC/SapB family protein [Aquabacterium sp. A7-Y]MCW7541197.1 MgtC/SapB family protein [Aquabacterium sp. A7-Y]